MNTAGAIRLMVLIVLFGLSMTTKSSLAHVYLAAILVCIFVMTPPRE